MSVNQYLQDWQENDIKEDLKITSVNQYLQDWQENDIKDDLKIMRVNNWTNSTQYRVTRKEVAEKTKTFQQCSYCA
jgi:hypothetical protein